MSLKVKATTSINSDKTSNLIAESYGITSMLRVCNELLCRGDVSADTQGDIAELLYRALVSEKKIREYLETIDFHQFHVENKQAA